MIASVPKIKLLKLEPPKFDFLTFEELERLLEAVKDDPEPRGASPFTHSTIETALRYVCKRAGFRPIGSHVLRHSFCSPLAMHGVRRRRPRSSRGTRPSR